MDLNVNPQAARGCEPALSDTQPLTNTTFTPPADTKQSPGHKEPLHWSPFVEFPSRMWLLFVWCRFVFDFNNMHNFWKIFCWLCVKLQTCNLSEKASIKREAASQDEHVWARGAFGARGVTAQRQDYRHTKNMKYLMSSSIHLHVCCGCFLI